MARILLYIEIITHPNVDQLLSSDLYNNVRKPNKHYSPVYESERQIDVRFER